MSRLATMAQEHFRQHLPKRTSQIKDQAAFFQTLEQEALDQIESLTEALAGPTPSEEDYAAKAARFSLARSNAEAQVIRELILPTPEADLPTESDPSEPQPYQESPEDQEIREAIEEFQAAREELIAAQQVPEPPTGA